MAEKQVRTISLNQMIARVLAVTLLVAAALMAIPIFELVETLKAKKQEEIRHHGQVVANQITDKMQSLGETAKHMAGLRQVKDMLLMTDIGEVQEWSVSTRKLFPTSVGMGLMTIEGEYLGDTRELRIGPACIRDTHEYLLDNLQGMPPVHDENPELAHFDLLHKVYDDEGKVTGTLLMSFHLDSLRDLISAYVEEDMQYRLITSDGKLLAGTGAKDYPYQSMVPITDTNWLLEVSADDSLSEESRHLISISITSLVIVLLIFALGVGPYLSRHLAADVNMVRTLMQYKNLDQDDNYMPAGGIRLREFSGLLDDIGQLARDIIHTRSRLETQANLDELTGLYNRRAFEKSRERLYQLAMGQVLVLVVLDIDYFKQINDTYGHAAGDYALKSLGAILKASVRSTDEVYRVGGDEILVVFTSDNRANLQHWFDSLSESLGAEMQRLEGLQGDGSSFTLSAGATVVNTAKDSTFSMAMVRADTALYEAKDSGRARMVVVD